MPSLRRSALLLARLGVLGVLVLGLLRMTLFTVYRVAGTSMEEALQDGDRIFVLDPGWVGGLLGVGDTVVLEVEQEVLVKRIVAGPFDHIAMRRGNQTGGADFLSLPNHSTLKASTLRALLTRAGISREDFLRAYDRA